MPQLSLPARLYVVTVVSAAAVLLGVAVVQRPNDRMSIVAILLILHVISESLLARGSRDMASISLGSVTSLAAIPLVGMWGAVIAAWSAVFAHDPDGAPVIKRVFNGAQMSVSVAAAGAAYHVLGGPIGLTAGDFPKVLVPILVADVVHCAVNGALVAIVVGLANRVSPLLVFQGTMARSVLAYLAYGLFGVSLAVLWDGAGVGPAAALLLLLPLFVARWAYAQYAEEQRAYDRTVRTLMAAVETKDFYTRGHSERVSAASVLVAREIGMREDRVASLRYAGMLHDIGKLGVPTRVLQKASGLTEGEVAAIQRHPMQGLEIVREIEFLDEAMAGIMHHHERMDGLGYPMGLTGDAIPEFARAIAVADAFDSMTTTRSYRGARTVAEAMTELRRCAGDQFDPQMVEALVHAVEEHGWDPEDVPVFALPTAETAEEPDTDQVFDQDTTLHQPEAFDESFDHDDPTAASSTILRRDWS